MSTRDCNGSATFGFFVVVVMETILAQPRVSDDLLRILMPYLLQGVKSKTSLEYQVQCERACGAL